MVKAATETKPQVFTDWLQGKCKTLPLTDFMLKKIVLEFAELFYDQEVEENFLKKNGKDLTAFLDL